jgi:hypothetical protein
MSIARAERVRESRMQDDIDERFGRQDRFLEALEKKIEEKFFSPKKLNDALSDWIEDPLATLGELFETFARERRKGFMRIDFALFGLFIARAMEKIVGDISAKELEEEFSEARD